MHAMSNNAWDLFSDEIQEMLRDTPNDSLLLLPLQDDDSGELSVHGFLKMNNQDAWQLLASRNASIAWGRRGKNTVLRVLLRDAKEAKADDKPDYEALVLVGPSRNEFETVRDLLAQQDQLNVHILTRDLRFLSSGKARISGAFKLPK